MKTIELPYGKDKVHIKLSQDINARLLKIKQIKPLDNFELSLNEALDKPIKARPLDKIISAEDRVAILIPDKTRRNYSCEILPILINRLNKIGIKHKRITIIIARGLHQSHTREELKSLVGEKIYETVRIIDHDCHKQPDLTYVGTTQRGTRFEVNRYAVEADKIIVTSTIQYHYYAGFSGGRKMILPGIAGYQTIQQNHSLVLNPLPAGGKNPDAVLGRLKGNPVNEDMVEAAKFMKVDFSINLVLNEARQIARIFCGDIIKAHQDGCEFLDKAYAVRLKKPADCIIATAGGYPSDIDFIQTHKTLEHASRGLKEHGVMIILAECSNGIGADDFLTWFKYQTPEMIEKKLRESFLVSGHTALCSLIKARRFTIYLLSQIEPDVVRQMQLLPVKDLQQTVDEVLSGLPDKAEVLIIPEGHNLVPIYSEER